MVANQAEMEMKFADAYSEAARAGADMRVTANTLETIRETLVAGTSPVAVMELFDEQVGRAEAERLMPVLVKLRTSIEEMVTRREVSRLRLISEKDPSKAWTAWLKSYVGCFGKRGWYTKLGWVLARDALASAPVPGWSRDRICECAAWTFHEKWADVYDWLLFLAEQDLTLSKRADLLVAAAEVQLYHFGQPTKTRNLLERAQQMAPDGIRIWVGFGELALQQNKLDEAKGHYEKILRKAPELSDGFVGLGDYFGRAGKPDAAEDQYEQAIFVSPGTTAGYERLMTLYGESQFYRDRQDRIESVFRRLLALDSPAKVWTQLGLVHRRNGVFDKARECFQEAINLDGSDYNARAWLGYAHLDENNYEAAVECFQKVVTGIPRALDGYLGISASYTQRKEWQASLEWCDRALSKCTPEWESFVRLRRAYLLQSLGRLSDAEADVLRSLELEPDNPSALDALSKLANAYISQDRDAAIRVFAKRRELQGETYEADFQNRVGNVWYYYGNYASAAECYRKAVAARPEAAVFHSNLALALVGLRTANQRLPELEEAIGQLRRAHELDATVTDYSERLGALEVEHRYLMACGEDAGGFETRVIPILVEANSLMMERIRDSSRNAISQEALAKTDEMHKRVHKRYGVTLPEVLYRELEPTPSDGRSYQITFMEVDSEPGCVSGQKFVHVLSGIGDPTGAQFQPPGMWISDDDSVPKDEKFELWTPLEWILRHVQYMAEGRLADFLGHQEVATLLDACKGESAKTIRSSSTELTAFVQVLRSMVNRHVPIIPMEEICSTFLILRNSKIETASIVERMSATLAASAVDKPQQAKVGAD